MNENKSLDTRNIFFQNGKKPIYYIPGYFRIKVKNFTEMNLDDLDAETNATIIFSVYCGGLPQKYFDQLQKNIILLFGRDDAIQLRNEKDNLQTKVAAKRDKGQIQFTVRKLFHLRIESDVFWSPFEIINLILSVTIQPVSTTFGTVKINLLDSKTMFLKLSYTEEGTFGNYDLAQKLMSTQYTNDRVCKMENFLLQNASAQKQQELKSRLVEELNEMSSQAKVQCFQYAHFNIPLYKYPIVALATIFLPLWLLAIINLGIFFQDQNLADRIASIAALMIAFVALIPTIRDQIPPNPKIVFIEILVYLETLTSLFALIHSLQVRQIDTFDLVWYQTGLFMVSAIITASTIVIVILMMFFHYFKWEPSYNKTLDQDPDKDVTFKREKWENWFCDAYFNTLIARNKKIKLQMVDDPLAKKQKKKQ